MFRGGRTIVVELLKSSVNAQVLNFLELHAHPQMLKNVRPCTINAESFNEHNYYVSYVIYVHMYVCVCMCVCACACACACVCVCMCACMHVCT